MADLIQTVLLLYRKNRQLASIILIISVGVALSIGFVWLKIAQNSQLNITTRISEVKGIVPGQGGGCESFLYDKQGIKHTVLPNGQVDSGGTPPFYDVLNVPGVLGTIVFLCGGETPAIDPNIAIQGIPFFPLHISVSLPDADMLKGQSQTLEVKAEISNTFSSSQNAVVYAVPFTLTDRIDIAYSLAAVNFNVVPQDVTINSNLNLRQPSVEKWSIAAKPEAIGKQEIIIKYKIKPQLFTGFYDEYVANGDIQVALDIQSNNSWIDPNIQGFITTIGAFILTFLGILKLIPETWLEYKKVNENSQSVDDKTKKPSQDNLKRFPNGKRKP